MVVNLGQETKEYLVFETATHSYKIEQKKLENLKSKENFPTKIATDIQKRMKQIVNNSNGQYWEESFQEILNKILNHLSEKKND